MLLTGLALQQALAPQAPQALQVLGAPCWAAAAGAQPPHHVQLQTDRPCRALLPGGGNATMARLSDLSGCF